MSFLNSFVSFLFEKSSERVLQENCVLSAAQLVWLGTLREDATTELVGRCIVAFFEPRHFHIVRTSPSVTTVIQATTTEGISVIEFKFGKKKGETDKVLAARPPNSFAAQNSVQVRTKLNTEFCRETGNGSVQLFGDLLHSFGESLVEFNLFKSQAASPIIEPEDDKKEEVKPPPVVEKKPKLEPYMSGPLMLSTSTDFQKIIMDNIKHDPSFGVFVALLNSGSRRGDIIMQILQGGVDSGFDLEDQSNTLIKLVKQSDGTIKKNKQGDRVLKCDYTPCPDLGPQFWDPIIGFLAENKSLKTQSEAKVPESTPTTSPVKQAPNSGQVPQSTALSAQDQPQPQPQTSQNPQSPSKSVAQTSSQPHEAIQAPRQPSEQVQPQFPPAEAVPQANPLLPPGTPPVPTQQLQRSKTQPHSPTDSLARSPSSKKKPLPPVPPKLQASHSSPNITRTVSPNKPAEPRSEKNAEANAAAEDKEKKPNATTESTENQETITGNTETVTISKDSYISLNQQEKLDNAPTAGGDAESPVESKSAFETPTEDESSVNTERNTDVPKEDQQKDIKYEDIPSTGQQAPGEAKQPPTSDTNGEVLQDLEPKGERYEGEDEHFQPEVENSEMEQEAHEVPQQEIQGEDQTENKESKPQDIQNGEDTNQPEHAPESQKEDTDGVGESLDRETPVEVVMKENMAATESEASFDKLPETLEDFLELEERKRLKAERGPEEEEIAEKANSEPPAPVFNPIWGL